MNTLRKINTFLSHILGKTRAFEFQSSGIIELLLICNNFDYVFVRVLV